MAKKKPVEEKVTEEVAEQVPEEIVFDTAVVGHIPLGNNKFQMVTVPLESKTLTLGKPELGKICDGVGEAKYEFKMAAFKHGLV
jgi:hypothetical protein